uniref:Uncharacterized protein n=1 Tax=Odontella aurita TaxID=265563 RepID=A0A7S4N468_9STRA|mmetsp:Transcript_46415/g.140567  ORF Transcript_46415/g.140567 Transcript_46415/m.140567 type:complete len:355 (+) Transcript_46415:227-1291(+)
MGTSSSKSGPASATSGGITASERRAFLRTVSDDYLRYLSSAGGTILTAERRCRVARWTVDAIDCEGCASLPQDACLRPGADLYAVLRSLGHGNGGGCGVDSEDEGCAADEIAMHLVHSLVSHQGRLDRAWFDETLRRLDVESGLLDESIYKHGTERRQCGLYALFSELVCLIGTVRALHATSMILGEDDKFIIPPAASASKVSSPSNLDWTSILKEGKAPHQKDKVAWMSCLSNVGMIHSDHPALVRALHSAGDFDSSLLSSDTARNYDNSHQAIISTYLRNLGLINPVAALVWSPPDFYWFQAVKREYYLHPAYFFSAFRPLQPYDRRCSREVSRLDIEVLARAVAKTFDCAF